MFFELVLFDIISFFQVYLVLNLSLSCCGFQTTTAFVFTQPKFRYWENCAACTAIIKYWSGFFYNLSKPWKKMVKSILNGLVGISMPNLTPQVFFSKNCFLNPPDHYHSLMYCLHFRFVEFRYWHSVSIC